MFKLWIALMLVMGAVFAAASPTPADAAAPVLQTPIPADSPFTGAHAVGDGGFTLTLGADGRARLDETAPGTGAIGPRAARPGARRESLENTSKRRAK